MSAPLGRFVQGVMHCPIARKCRAPRARKLAGRREIGCASAQRTM